MPTKLSKIMEVIQNCIKEGRGCKITTQSGQERILIADGLHLILVKEPPKRIFFTDPPKNPKKKSRLCGKLSKTESYGVPLDMIIKAEPI